MDLGINDSLNLRSVSETVPDNTLHITNHCKNCEVNEDSVSSRTCTTLLSAEFTNDVSNALRNKCQTSGYQFKNNITMEHFQKDGLHPLQILVEVLP